MADKRDANEIVTVDPTFEEKALETFYKARESWQKNQSLWSAVLAIVVCAAGAWGFFAWKARSAEAESTRILGRGLVHLSNDRIDSALSVFQGLAVSHTGLATSKASLLAGNILLTKSDWKGAEASFSVAIKNADGLPLLDGGARRGLAVSLIEQNRFEEAATELEKVVSNYARTPVEIEKREKENAPSDDLPALSQAYWQLVLVQEKLGRKEDARKNAEHLIRAYPTSDEANEARRWLAINGMALSA